MIELDKKEYLGENEEGYEFFLSKNLTAYAKEQGFDNILVTYVRKKDAKNYEAILLLKDRTPIFESRTILISAKTRSVF